MGEFYDKTVLVSLPLLVRDWLLKEYPGKCCISIKEYHDIEFNFTENKEVDKLSGLVVATNAKLTSSPDCAYLIDITMDSVEAHFCVGLPTSVGAAVIKKSQVFTIPLDWRAPSFFKLLADAIGCQCKQQVSPKS